jgi:hypothetical protein
MLFRCLDFGANVVFIPDRDSVQTNLTGQDIHRQCMEDKCGCWTMSAGVVHDKWKDTPWPARLAYDYGFYIVDDNGQHDGTQCGSDALDKAVPEMDFKVGLDPLSSFVHGYGYSLEYNPDFRYCAETMSTRVPTQGVTTYWLDNCGLTGGSSGGPWVMEMDEESGAGTVFSVNSWSYSSRSGMGAPMIEASAGRCLMNAARDSDFSTINAEAEGEEGLFVNCYNRPCIPVEEVLGRKLRGAPSRKLCKD